MICTGHRAVDRDDMHEPGLENLLLTRLSIGGPRFEPTILPSRRDGGSHVWIERNARNEARDGTRTNARHRFFDGKDPDALRAKNIGSFLYSFGFDTIVRSRGDRIARSRTRFFGSSLRSFGSRRFSSASRNHGSSIEEDTSF